MNQRRKVAIGLGSNLGDRIQFIQKAIERLREDCVEDVIVSAAYESEPWGVTDQPDFLNAVITGTTEWKAPALVSFLKTTENELGRTKTFNWGPREIDLDLLLCADEIWSDPAHRVPHPGITERDFVLLPLVEIWPDAMHPVLHKTVKQILAEFQSSRQVTSKYFAPLQ